ncbi:hypothetical protein ACS0TY_032491 [Phlomoides rotata]
MLRVATMMTILDNVRTRIQKCQSFGNKRSEAALRRCNTDLRPNHPPKDKRVGGGGEAAVDEKEKLKRELAACTAAKRSLEMMCSSLGKEKVIMAKELSRKAHALNEMEELVSDLKAQNEELVKKLQKCGGGQSDGMEAVQERIKNLTELLLRSNDGCRVMKKKIEEAEQESAMLYSTIGRMGVEIEASLGRIKRLGNPDFDVQDDILVLENMLQKMQSLLKE